MPRQRDATPRTPVLAWAALGLGLAAASPAAAEQPVPEGLVVGPWVLAPALHAEYLADSNVFREDDAFQPESDRIATLRGRLDAHLLFSNSKLGLFYEGSLQEFDRNRFSRDTGLTLGADLLLDFGRGTTLRLGDTFRRDYTRIDDEVPDAVFRGEPFNVNRWEIDLSREVPNRRGFAVRVARTDFIFAGRSATGLYDYRGFSGSAEYRHPLPGRRWLTAGYSGRRFNHFRPNCHLQAVECQVGVPFRRESFDGVSAGLRGRLGERQLYMFNLGAGQSELTGERASEFGNVVAEGTWEVRAGERTAVRFALGRRPLPSTDDSLYILTDVSAALDLRLSPVVRVVAQTLLGRADYDQFIPGLGCPAGTPREDRRFDMQGAVSWAIHPRLAIRADAGYDERGSNCNVGYEAVHGGIGLSFGWF